MDLRAPERKIQERARHQDTCSIKNVGAQIAGPLNNSGGENGEAGLVINRPPDN